MYLRLMAFVLVFGFYNSLSAQIIMTKVENGTNEDINAHGTCKNVANATGKDLMVPTKTSAEWSAFRAATITNVTISDCDLCPGVSTIGQTCPNGAKYLGTYNYGGSIGTKKLLITPGTCNDSATPTCPDSGLDTVIKTWQASPGTTATGATSTSDGYANTNSIIASGGLAEPAAEFCANMTFAGLSEWYLPAQDEWAHVITNMTALGASTFGCQSWTSTETTASNARYGGDNSGYCASGAMGKTNTNRVRCILRY